MAIRERLSGNEAVATAMKQINPDTVAAYPITPSTEIPQYFSSFVANGSVTTEFIPVESEHSAMAATIGAAAAGGRVMSATSSQGLALMFEMLYVASGMRLPLTLICANRALSAPINIHNDHSDSMGVRDCGFIQLYCENNQEAYDNTIMAVKIAEKAKLPVMVCYDGFITSHSIENIMLLETKEVQDFLGEYSPENYLLNKDNNISYGPLALQKYYFKIRKELSEAMDNTPYIINEVADEFYTLTGRKYDLYEKYRLDDAEIGIIALNSTAGTIKDTIDVLRNKGIKIGLLKPRCFRPLPYLQIPNELNHLKALAIMDKADSINGYCGPLFSEITSAMFSQGILVPTTNYIYGLGGADTKMDDIKKIAEKLLEIKSSGKADKIKHFLINEEEDELNV